MSVRGVRLWRRTDSSLPPSLILEKNGITNALLLQNNAIITLEPDATEVERRAYLKITDAYGLLGVLRITKDESLLVAVTGVLSVGQLYGLDILKITSVEFVSLRSFSPYDDPRISDLQRLLSSGMFYFSSSPKLDLTCSAQRRAAKLGPDTRFFWNRSLHFSFERYGIDTSEWLLKCMAGSILVRTVYLGHRTGRVALLSRLSCERVGTRFNVRGANHLGCVANFVETEQLLIFEESECSMLQVRGSIPLFWEQPGVQVGSHKVKLRAFETSGPAFHRHFTHLKSRYNETVIVNLLGRKEGERTLAEAFRTQHKKSQFASSVEFVDFDLHAQMKISKDSMEVLKKKLVPFTQKFGLFVMSEGNVTRNQTGVIRTNCLDCLDRTNNVQTAIGLQAVRSQVEALGLLGGKVNIEQRIEEVLRDLWQKNGDQCSTIYAGTGALDGKNKLKDASRSIARTIQNNLMDGSKQESFDLFLAGSSFDARLFDQVSNILPTSVVQEYADAMQEVIKRRNDITIPNPIKIFVGTWNVNGGKNMYNIAFRNESKLSDWIFPHGNLLAVDDLSDSPDIVAIGVEELVDLNASNMMKASTTNQRLWSDGIRKTLMEHAPYALIASEQLVGVCLFLFVRPRLAPFLKDFSVASVKTGLGGATGNKGSVAMRMVVHSTSVCFVCSHFAAGQNEVRDRNDDYLTAMRRIRFPQGRDIESNDIIFWLGDFNYRINLPGEEVKKAVANNQLSLLVPNDQLTQQRAQSLTFVDFDEGPLHFAPTYKYDTFSDDYDTSEKCRSPAWTDRILWKEQRRKEDTRQISYYRSELKTSDHRPVGSLFFVNSYKVESIAKCQTMLEEVISGMGPPDATIIVSVVDGRFPSVIFNSVAERISQIPAKILISKYEDGSLWVVLESGESALAALSMDGIKIENHTLTVRLRSPDWTDRIVPTISEFDVAMETFTREEDDIISNIFDYDEDEEELMSSMTASSLGSARSTGVSPVPPPPRPPSSHTPTPSLPQRYQASDLDWPSDNGVVHAIPTRSAPPSDPRPPTLPSRSAPPPPKAVAPSQSVPPPFDPKFDPWASSVSQPVVPSFNPFGDPAPPPPDRQSSTNSSFDPFGEKAPPLSFDPFGAPPLPLSGRGPPPPVPPPRPQLPVIPPRPKGF